jgi:DNA modification methylase
MTDKSNNNPPTPKPDGRKNRVNKLNDLNGKEWIKFQKSWFILNPRRRKKETLLHPAKYPEELVDDFVRFFTKKGQIVLDPMAGTGSSIVAAVQADRIGFGIELVPDFAKVASKRVSLALDGLYIDSDNNPSKIINGDARNIADYEIPPVDYVITSPPYWDMLHRGGYFRKERGNSSAENLVYSEDANDVGNIDNYDEFVQELVEIYRRVGDVMKPKAYMTIIVKNVKKGGRMYPLAWDLGRELSNFFTLKDEKIWCQDNQCLAPFGMYSAWVSNTFHQYCLQFRKE